MPKVGTQLLLNARDRDRVRALAYVRGQLQAEMLRQLVEYALTHYEQGNAAELVALRTELARLGVREQQDEAPAVSALLRERIPVGNLRYVDVFPATMTLRD